jgi:hypothetical protein
LLLLLTMAAVWESVASLWPPRIFPHDVQALAAAVRASHQPGDLIAVAPDWLSPLIRRELGDLMPVEQVARADGRRFARITEVSLPPHHAADVDGLPPQAGTQRFGRLQLAHYQQTPVVVAYDLTEHFLDLTASQLARTQPSGELPCLWSGPLPAAVVPLGPMGAFVCGSTRVERRTMEIDYQPRRGIVTELAAGQKTLLRFSIPDSAWQGSTLHLWLGLHDYHQRKQAQGPVVVTVDLDDGQALLPLMVSVGQGFGHHQLSLPPSRAEVHHLKLVLEADSAPHHFLGLHGELRR